MVWKIGKCRGHSIAAETERERNQQVFALYRVRAIDG